MVLDTDFVCQMNSVHVHFRFIHHNMYLEFCWFSLLDVLGIPPNLQHSQIRFNSRIMFDCRGCSCLTLWQMNAHFKALRCGWNLLKRLDTLPMRSLSVTYYSSQQWQHALPYVSVMILGNKCDLEDDREVSEERGRMVSSDEYCKCVCHLHKQLAAEYGVTFMEVSAKTGHNVERVSTDT